LRLEGIQFMEHPDITKIRESVLKLGFKTPPIRYEKQDIRGPEYGRYSVEIEAEDQIRVSHMPPADLPNARTYTMFFFTLEDFEIWSNIHT
jgi:hypothetical protein